MYHIITSHNKFSLNLSLTKIVIADIQKNQEKYNFRFSVGNMEETAERVGLHFARKSNFLFFIFYFLE